MTDVDRSVRRTPAMTAADEFILFEEALDTLRDRFPEVPEARLVGVLAAEWNAFTGGRPTHIPPEVLAGTLEVLGR